VEIDNLVSNENQTLFTLKATASTKTLNTTVILLILIVSWSLAIILLIPIFKYEYIVTSTDGTNTYAHGITSLLNAYFKYNNHLSFITFLCVFTNVCLSISNLVLADYKKLDN